MQSPTTPAKGLSKNEAAAIIPILKEKLLSELNLFKEPVIQDKDKKKWSKKDNEKFSMHFLGKSLIDSSEIGWVDHPKEGGIITFTRIGIDNMWTDDKKLSVKKKYKCLSSKIMSEICHQTCGKGFERFSIIDQAINLAKFYLLKFKLVDGGGSKDTTKLNCNDAFLVMNIIFSDAFKSSLLKIFDKEGRQKIDSNKKFSRISVFCRNVFSIYQSKDDFKKYCTLLSSSTYDKDNGLSAAFYKKLNLINSKRYEMF